MGFLGTVEVTLDGKHLLISGIEWIAMFRTDNDEKIMYLNDVGDGGMYPFTVDSKLKRAYLSRTKHVGFEIVDLELGEKIITVQDGRPPIPRRTHGAALTPDDRRLVELHPTYGAELLTRHASDASALAAAVGKQGLAEGMYMTPHCGAGVDWKSEPPRSGKRAFIRGSAKAAAKSRCRRSTIGPGVLRGASSACHCVKL